jgi:hypothetical protein
LLLKINDTSYFNQDFLKVKKFFPIHSSMFVLARHPWNDPVKQLYMLSKTHQIDLVVPKLGQLVNFSEELQLDEWWIWSDKVPY